MIHSSDADTAVASRRGRDPHAHASEHGPADIGHADRRYRRRPAMIGLGLALLAVCGAGAAYLTQRSGDTVPVLAVAADVHRGQVISDSDLTSARAVPDPALDPVAVAERDHVVGQRAAADLTAGSLLTPASVTAGELPAAGQTIVGVAVTKAQTPREELVPGDPVRIFDTPRQGDAPPKAAPASTPATVVGVSRLDDNGMRIVDVLVTDDAAGTLVARVATGRVAIVLDSAADLRETPAGGDTGAES
ncbi:SAF domain-containing protein [Haloactinopolyspora alba]|uniref:SAF domain-containing protein n=1 Tax=Haloactinopolyspora alba TaxID=648780 RepID=A0A2P8E763_9ACTN|nr:SAF domain-containing protein [Haloactinopolyspora alba]PSL05303.1 SAF domain-containing protein [Haloactinopolyspora alba]